jgi:SAM-dependent methyltransferase
LSTDTEWEKWGARDPYYGVLSTNRFRRDALTPAALDEFFALGREHVQTVLQTCRERLDPTFAPRRVLDFGCGVGRIVIPFAGAAEEVVGLDVSPSMLAEAARNCAKAGLANVRLLRSDDTLSALDGRFDLVHSCLVLQHIEIERGLGLFQGLVERVAPGGIGVLHVTLAWDWHDANRGVAPPPPPPLPWWRGWRRRLAGGGLRSSPPPAPGEPPSDPEMQMNFYNLSQLMYLLQRRGVREVHTQLTDHGGAIGAFLYFRMPPGATG